MRNRQPAGIVLGILVGLVILVRLSAAQTIQFNRVLEHVDVKEAESGLIYNLEAAWNIRDIVASGPVDLSTEVVLLVNGREVDSIRNPAPLGPPLPVMCGGEGSEPPACAGFCPECPGTGSQGLCGPTEGGKDCGCGFFLTAPFPGQPLRPEDEIMVLLRPAPGALPEAETLDDCIIFTVPEAGSIPASRVLPPRQRGQARKACSRLSR